MIARPGNLALLAAGTVALALCAGCGQKEGGSANRVGFMEKLLGPPAPKLVDMALDPGDPDRRREGVTRLARKEWGLREPYLKAYAALLEKDSDASVRCAAARALGQAADPTYLPQLAAALSDGADDVRWDAAVALDRVVGDAAVEPLRRHATGDASQDVRASCAKALRHYPRPEVVQTLIQCLSDKTFGVRYAAHASLVDLTGRDPGYDPAAWAAPGAAALKAPDAGGDRRPWWDWAGVTRKGGDEEAKLPAGAPAPPEEQSPPQAKGPWWDWMGVTGKRSGAPAGETEEAPPGPPADRRKPWWDWFGVTGRAPAEEDASP